MEVTVMKKRTLLGLAIGAAAGVGVYKYLQNKKAEEAEDFDFDDLDDDFEDAADDATDAAADKVEELAEELKDAAEDKDE